MNSLKLLGLTTGAKKANELPHFRNLHRRIFRIAMAHVLVDGKVPQPVVTVSRRSSKPPRLLQQAMQIDDTRENAFELFGQATVLFHAF